MLLLLLEHRRSSSSVVDGVAGSGGIGGCHVRGVERSRVSRSSGNSGVSSLVHVHVDWHDGSELHVHQYKREREYVRERVCVV
jgi:hypothetical protein